MAIPNYQTLMLPLLQAVKDGKEHILIDVEETIAACLGLTAEERQLWYPSGNQRILKSRITWAGTYLKQAQLLANDIKGKYKITERGLKLLAEKPPSIDNQLLSRYREFREYSKKSGKLNQEHSVENESTLEMKTDNESADPTTVIETQYAIIQETLGSELLTLIKQASPGFFEYLVVNLLFAMGYGGSHQDIEEAVIGKSGDEGIDGVIKQDKLGLEAIYVQAKRYKEQTVGRPEIQSFVGSMAGFHATKGVFFTASSFTSTASAFLSKVDKKIILIDGQQLVKLMIEHNIGVEVQNSYTIKQINREFFSLNE